MKTVKRKRALSVKLARRRTAAAFKETEFEKNDEKVDCDVEDADKVF